LFTGWSLNPALLQPHNFHYKDETAYINKQLDYDGVLFVQVEHYSPVLYLSPIETLVLCS